MTITTQGSVSLKIGGKDIKLNGLVGGTLQVGFREKNGDDPIVLGKFKDIVTDVATAILEPADATKFETEFNARVTDLSTTAGPLGAIGAKLLSSSLIVTDLAISATYDDTAGTLTVDSAAFGFRVEFDDIKLGPVELVGFGVLFEYSVTAKTGKLTSRAQSKTG
ncbi:hypothetical protein [Robiginitomaculum antarcticum]|uniref:hypothetical protein n=1 Tax=Robiginitomaculum antarcticum TaxID=437507 RepID=UPI0003722D96|nr:hypothetical protein [Robiginitomaculum antarcticum]